MGVGVAFVKWAYVYLVKLSIRRCECGEWDNHVLLNVGSFPPPDVPIDIGPNLLRCWVALVPRWNNKGEGHMVKVC